MPTDWTSPEGRAELRRLLKGGTAGPWRSTWTDELVEEEATIIVSESGDSVVAAMWWDGPWMAITEPDAALIAAARNALPALLDRVEALEAAGFAHESTAAALVSHIHINLELARWYLEAIDRERNPDGYGIQDETELDRRVAHCRAILGLETEK